MEMATAPFNNPSGELIVDNWLVSSEYARCEQQRGRLGFMASLLAKPIKIIPLSVYRLSASDECTIYADPSGCLRIIGCGMLGLGGNQLFVSSELLSGFENGARSEIFSARLLNAK